MIVEELRFVNIKDISDSGYTEFCFGFVIDVSLPEFYVKVLNPQIASF